MLNTIKPLTKAISNTGMPDWPALVQVHLMPDCQCFTVTAISWHKADWDGNEELCKRAREIGLRLSTEQCLGSAQ